MLLYRTATGPVLELDGKHFALKPADWDWLINRDDLPAWLRAQAVAENQTEAPVQLLAPIGSQEVWAAGVTYFRSRTARMEESKEAGGGSFYDRVYAADRPEIFFKGTPHRVIAPGGTMHRRRDSKWMVPEPELTLVLNHQGRIVGYTCGNDLSCRDIEGENPLYLPQAKVFGGCAAVGPAILVAEQPIAKETTVHCEIMRAGNAVFSGDTTLAQLKRTPEELAGWLFKEESFPNGCYMMTGTGIVPPDEFTLQAGDEVRITIAGIGTLVNQMD
jgi:2-dehydro-3-deoxy-D-arabinonate dehydratase